MGPREIGMPVPSAATKYRNPGQAARAACFLLIILASGAAFCGSVPVEDEIAAKTNAAAHSLLRQLEKKGYLASGKTVMCVLPTRDAHGRATVLGKNASDAISRALLADGRIELASELSVGAADLRLAGTLYPMEGRRIEIAFRCGNNPSDPYSEQRHLAMETATIILPSDAALRRALLRSIDDAPEGAGIPGALSLAAAVQCQRRLDDGTIVTEAFPLSGGSLRSGEQFRIRFHGDASEDAYVYVVWRDGAGRHFLAWPGEDGQAVPAAWLPAGRSLTVPHAADGKASSRWFALDDEIGEEAIFLLAHTSRKTGVSDFLDSLDRMDGEAADIQFREWLGTFAWEKRFVIHHLPDDAGAP